MANVRFLDQVAVNSFANGTNTSTAYGATLPRVILSGAAFTISPNTSVSTWRLTVAGTLVVESGPQVQLPDGSVVRADGTLYIGDTLYNQGIVNNAGVIEIGGDQN